MPSMTLAFSRTSMDSLCLPALCSCSPSARNFLTFSRSPALSFGDLASAASISFMSVGHSVAKPGVAQAIATRATRTAIFLMGYQLLSWCFFSVQKRFDEYSRFQAPTENPPTADASHRRDEGSLPTAMRCAVSWPLAPFCATAKNAGARLQQLLVPGPDLDERR